ncbi:hypothetical protein [Massilia sp. TSP1-1-2]|uniref:hypothetical protein n=1 Tax=Massilia sp. TSP1-1-2 TaxID=2804649 RepID=UPI003CF0F74A
MNSVERAFGYQQLTEELANYLETLANPTTAGVDDTLARIDNAHGAIMLWVRLTAVIAPEADRERIHALHRNIR